MKRSEKKELERYKKIFGNRLTYDMTLEEKKMPITKEVSETLRHRLAQRLTGVDGIDSMLMLTVDRHLYKMVDKEDYLKELRGMKGFFIWFVNMIADHPIMSKRIPALQEGCGSGKVY